MSTQDENKAAYSHLGDTWAQHRKACILQRYRQFGQRGRLDIDALLARSARLMEPTTPSESSMSQCATLA